MDITLDSSGLVDLDSRSRVHVALKRAADYTHSNVDIGLDVAGLFYHQSPAFGDELAGHFTVHQKHVREQNLACDNLSFNPWHSLPEHRPIGGINRLRKAVYETVSAYRHERNGASDATTP